MAQNNTRENKIQKTKKHRQILDYYMLSKCGRFFFFFAIEYIPFFRNNNANNVISFDGKRRSQQRSCRYCRWLRFSSSYIVNAGSYQKCTIAFSCPAYNRQRPAYDKQNTTNAGRARKCCTVILTPESIFS